jgi:purine-cytosine permease-like protein
MFQALGWIGVLIALGAQLSMAAKWIPAGRLYHLLNVAAGTLLGIAAWEKGNYPTVGLQIAWSLISFYGISKQRQTREP